MKPTSRPALLAMLSAAMVTAEFVGGKATREALFLTSLGFQALPAMLVAASACTLLLVAAHARWASRLAPSAFVQILLAASGVLFLCEWIIRFNAPAASAVLVFLHTSALAPLLSSSFWLITTERFDPRTAKRRFGQITAASTGGGLLGALVSERVAAIWGAPAMLLVLGGVQLLTVLLCSRFTACIHHAADPEHLAKPPATAAAARSGLRLITEAPHLRHLVVFVLLGSTSAALLDYLFKAKAVEAIGTGDQLLRFFALYYAAINVITFIFQSLSSRIALERFGLGLTTSTPSIAVLAGAIGGLMTPGFGGVVAARAAEAIFKTSWFRASYELFYTPIPAAEKRSVKSIVDVGVERLGEAVAGGLVRMVVFLAPAVQSSAILWVAATTAAAAIVAATRLNHWYVRTLGTSLVSQAPGLGPSDTAGHVTRRMLLKVQGSPRPSVVRPDDMDDARALHSSDHGRASEVLAREDGLSAALVPHAIPLLDGPLSDYAIFALRKVAEERIGQLTDALLDPNQDDEVRRQLARVFSVAVSQRAADGLMLALDDERVEVRHQAARSLGLILNRNQRIRVDRDRILEVVLREVAAGRPVWESRHALDGPVNESILDEVVHDRGGQSLAHVFTLLSLILPSQPLHIAFRSLHSQDSRLRGTALEYLEGVLPTEVRQQLWPFLVRGDASRPPHQPQNLVVAELVAIG